MNDLHCPARLVLLRQDDTDGGSTGSTADRRARTAVVAEALGPRNVALVYTSPEADAVRTAEVLAARLAVPVEVVPELREVPPGPPGAPEADVVRRFDAAVGGIADLHRGETVVVVAPAGLLGVPLGRALEPGELLEIEHDGPGWTVRRPDVT